MLLSEAGEAGMFRAGFSYAAPSEWDLSWLVFLRHPLVLGPRPPSTQAPPACRPGPPAGPACGADGAVSWLLHRRGVDRGGVWCGVA